MNVDDLERQMQAQPLRALPEEWRGQIMAAAQASASPLPSRPITATLPRATAASWLRSLVWPRPAAWGALGAAWLVILALNLSTVLSGRPDAAGATAARPAVDWETVLAWRQQAEAELAKLDASVEIKPAKPQPALRPRSLRSGPAVFRCV